jgi:hypothetical protein
VIYKTEAKLPAREELLRVAGHEKNDARRRTGCRSKDITEVQIAGRRNVDARQAGARRSDRKLQSNVLATGSCRIGFIAQALVIFASSLKSVRERFFHRGPGILPLQFFKVSRHLGRDLIKLFAAISGVQSSFEAQEVEFLAVSEVPARFEIVFQSRIHIRLVLVHHVLLTVRLEWHDGFFWSSFNALRRGFSDDSSDLAHVFIREAELAGTHDSLGLTRVAGADDSSCNCGVK